MKGPVDDRGDHALGIVIEQRLLQNGLPGPRFAQDQTEAALLGVDTEDVEAFLLMRQERDGLGIERTALETKVGADHRIYDLRFWIYDWAGAGGSGFRVPPCVLGRGFLSLATGSSRRASPILSPL